MVVLIHRKVFVIHLLEFVTASLVLLVSIVQVISSIISTSKKYIRAEKLKELFSIQSNFLILTSILQRPVQQTKLPMQTYAKTALQGRFLMLCRTSLHVLPVIQKRSLTTAHVKHVQKDKFQTPIKQSVKLH
jgi:hypothetical protein